MENQTIDFASLRAFLCEAKRNTYASQGGERAVRLRDGSHEYTYKKALYFYLDRWFGSNPFAGSEMVWLDDVPVWAMHYYGETTHAIPKQVFDVLRLALLQVEESAPFRGPVGDCRMDPHNLNRNDWLYHNEVNGTIENFWGGEHIMHEEKLVYSAYYHGGLVR